MLREIATITILSTVIMGASAQTPAALPQDVLAAALQQAECEGTPEDAAASIQSFDLGGDVKLIKVMCWLAAYNEGSILFAVDPAHPSTAKMQQFMEWDVSANTWTPKFVLVGVEYNANAKQITTFNRFRGIGDCGSSGVWTWSASGFSMTTYSVKEDCDDAAFDAATQPQWKIYPPS